MNDEPLTTTTLFCAKVRTVFVILIERFLSVLFFSVLFALFDVGGTQLEKCDVISIHQSGFGNI